MAMAQLETAEVLQMGMPLFYAAVIIFCFDNWKNIGNRPVTSGWLESIFFIPSP